MCAWFPSPQLAADEVVVFQAAANHLPSPRTIGGQITVTDRRLLFVPNRLDGSTGGRKVDIPREGITSMRVLDPGWRTLRSRGFGALLRPQLAVEWVGGTAVLIVRDLNALQAALAS